MVVLSWVSSDLALNDMVEILEIELVCDGFALVSSLDDVLCVIRVHELLTALLRAIIATLLIVLSQE